MLLNWQYSLLIAALFMFLVPDSAQTEVKNSTPKPLGKLVDVGGYRVHLYCTGTGSPTVVITGAGYSFDWGLVQPEVAKFTRVCTYDHSGVAWKSTPPPGTNKINHLRSSLNNQLLNAEMQGTNLATDTQGTNTSR
jgi:hypothetical protein